MMQRLTDSRFILENLPLKPHLKRLSPQLDLGRRNLATLH